MYQYCNFQAFRESSTSLKELFIWCKIRSQCVLKKICKLGKSSMVHKIGMLWNIGKKFSTAANSKKLG